MSAMEAKPTGQETIAAIMIMNKDSDDDDELPTDGGVSDSHEGMVFTDDDDDLFELDIALLRGFDDDDDLPDRPGAGRDGAGDGCHALLANCLLPVSSVSMAVPVAASNTVSSYYANFSAYSGSRRLGISCSGRRRIGRAAAHGGSSSWAKFRLSSRGFATVGNFQR